jgi:hypothetical protein
MRSSLLNARVAKKYYTATWCYFATLSHFGRLSVSAFVVPSSTTFYRGIATNHHHPTPWQTECRNDRRHRLYSSWRGNDNNNNDKDKSIFSKISDKVKSYVPSLQTEEEKTVAIERQQRKDEVTGGIDKMLKDAPFGLRMMGKMVAPIIGNMASNLAEAVAEQSRQMEDLLNDAQTFIMMDEQALQQLGEPIQVSMPFSQSSSTMSINGKTTKNLQASFQVTGSYASGTATMIANESGINNLTLNVGGWDYYIDVSNKSNNNSWSPSPPGDTSNLGRNTNINNNDVIDAEFVDKKWN